MVTIILEGVLFVALLAAVGALAAYGVRFTPPGRWIRQTGNRRRIEREAADAAAARCAVHGDFGGRDLVRLPDGGRMCPSCYAEICNVQP